MCHEESSLSSKFTHKWTYPSVACGSTLVKVEPYWCPCSHQISRILQHLVILYIAQHVLVLTCGKPMHDVVGPLPLYCILKHLMDSRNPLNSYWCNPNIFVQQIPSFILCFQDAKLFLTTEIYLICIFMLVVVWKNYSLNWLMILLYNTQTSMDLLQELCKLYQWLRTLTQMSGS